VNPAKVNIYDIWPKLHDPDPANFFTAAKLRSSIVTFHPLDFEMPVWLDPAEGKSELVRLLYLWWEGARGDADVPDRANLHPEDIKQLLPFVFISDAEHEPFRVRYRLVGTRAAEVTGIDIVGRYLDELVSAEPDSPWMGFYRQAYLTRRPLLGSTTVPTSSGAMFTYEFGIFPMRKGKQTIDQFIALEDYFGLVHRIVQPEPWQELPH
jgi:hypothetical protein